MSSQQDLLYAIRSMMAGFEKWTREGRDYIAECFEQGVENLLNHCGVGPDPLDASCLPEACNGIVAIAARVAIEWDGWKEESLRTQRQRLMPSDGFWVAVAEIPGELASVRGGKWNPPRETIASLVRQQQQAGSSLTDTMIVRMWDLYDEHGMAQPGWIDEELKDPGCHTLKSATWMPKLRKKDQEEIAEEQASMAEIIAKAAAKREVIVKDSRETIPELVGQGVTLSQIARMKRKADGSPMSEQDVRDECTKFGWQQPLAGPVVPFHSPISGKEMTAEEAATFDQQQGVAKWNKKAPRAATVEPPAQSTADQLSLDGLIVEAHNNGNSIDQIVTECTEAGLQTTKAYVKRVVAAASAIMAGKE